MTLGRLIRIRNQRLVSLRNEKSVSNYQSNETLEQPLSRGQENKLSLRKDCEEVPNISRDCILWS